MNNAFSITLSLTEHHEDLTMEASITGIEFLIGGRPLLHLNTKECEDFRDLFNFISYRQQELANKAAT